MARSIDGGTDVSPAASMAARSMLTASRWRSVHSSHGPSGMADGIALGLDAGVEVGLEREHVVGTAHGSDAGHDHRGQLAELAQGVGPRAGVAVERVGGHAEAAHRAGEQDVDRRHEQHQVLGHLPRRRHRAGERAQPRRGVDGVGDRPRREVVVELRRPTRGTAAGSRRGWAAGRAARWSASARSGPPSRTPTIHPRTRRGCSTARPAGRGRPSPRRRRPAARPATA